MQFIAPKCHTLRVSRSRNPVIHRYVLHNQVLEEVDTATYLGVEIAKKLDWKPHVDKICSKANRMLGFVRKNLRSCPKSVKEVAYNTLVRPTLEYSSTVWSPHTAVCTNKIEVVQRHAAHFVLQRYHNTSSVTSMLESLQWQTLAQRREIARLTMLYKIYNNLVDINPQNYLFLLPHTQGTRRANTLQFERIGCFAPNYYSHSFFPATINMWNRLPDAVVSEPTLVGFKQSIASYYTAM